MAKISRNYDYCHRTLDEAGNFPEETVVVSKEHLELTVLLAKAERRYRTVVDSPKPVDFRTLTHSFPRKTADPVLRGFKHKTLLKDRLIKHSIEMPPEVLEAAKKLQERLGQTIFIHRLTEFLRDCQPESNPELLRGTSRVAVNYDIPRIQCAIRKHAIEWDFCPCNLVRAYSRLGEEGVTVLQWSPEDVEYYDPGPQESFMDQLTGDDAAIWGGVFY